MKRRWEINCGIHITWTRDKVKVPIAKNSNFIIFHKVFLQLVNKMGKYEMDTSNIVEHRAWTRLCPQTGRRTDGQTDKVKSAYSSTATTAQAGVIIRQYLEIETWITEGTNFEDYSRSVGERSYVSKVWDKITYAAQMVAVAPLGFRMESNLILHFIMGVLSYLWWD